MDAVRVGLGLRALRRRLGWTQGHLGERIGLSASAVSRLERGHANVATVRTLDRAASALGARLSVQLLWQGEGLDRLLDSEHARLVDWLLALHEANSWQAVPEVTFQVRGERGSIDILAHRPNALLVVEVKSVVPDVQALLAGLDRKARLAPLSARERGWPADPVSRILVVPADRTARRRITALRATFRAALPHDTTAARAWIAQPVGQLAAVLFVPNVTDTATRHRVGHRRANVPPIPRSTHERRLARIAPGANSPWIS